MFENMFEKALKYKPQAYTGQTYCRTYYTPPMFQF